MDVINELCGLRRRLDEIAICLGADADRNEVAADLRFLGEILDRAIVPASLTIEALNPILDDGNKQNGELTVLDLCYNAFMIGRRQENRETGDRTAWFDDCEPLMKAGVNRILKETIQRMEYARDDSRRSVIRNVEKIDCTLLPEQIDAGAACLYGHLDQSFTGGGRVSYPQASSHIRGKYQRAFASAVREANTVKEAA